MTRRPLLVLMILALSTIMAQAYAQSTCKLQYKFVPNQLLRYKFDTTANVTIQMDMEGADQLPAIPMKMSGVIRQRTKSISTNGDATLAVAFESLSISVNGSSMPTDVNTMPVITMIMSPDGQVKSIQGMDKMPSAFGGAQFMSSGGLGQSSAFPSTVLKVGDTWTQDVPVALGGNLKVQAKLISFDGNVATVRQTIGGIIDVTSPLPGTQATAMAKGDLNTLGSMVFSTQEGRMVKSDASGTITMNITGSDVTGDMRSVTEIHSKMELLK